MAGKSPTNDKKDKLRAQRGIVPSEKRTRWAKPVSQAIDRLTKGILGKQGFTHGAIVTKWPEIVGENIARHTQPEKIIFSRDGATGGTLHLKTDSGGFAMELQHMEPQIVERINAFFGYRAVVRIKLIQGPLPTNKMGQRTQPPRALNAAQTKALKRSVAPVDDLELKEALEKLGQSVMARHKDTD